jgi:hypothetical protein
MEEARSKFYEVGAASRIAINLFYGWGYNFYRTENQMRSDDLLIRQKVGGLLGEVRKIVSEAEGMYRREFIPPPTRDKPTFDPQILRNARDLEALAALISGIEGKIRSSAVPETDRIWQRHRREANTLAGLMRIDEELSARAESLRQALIGMMPLTILDQTKDIKQAIADIEETLSRRNALLSV